MSRLLLRWGEGGGRCNLFPRHYVSITVSTFLALRVRSCSADCVLTMLPWYVYFQFTILALVKEEIHTICPRPNFSDVFYSFAGNVPEYLGKN